MRRREIWTALVTPAAATAPPRRRQSLISDPPHHERSAAEIAARVTPADSAYEPLDVRRYGASSANTGAANALALQNAVHVLMQTPGGELYIPEGLALDLAQVSFVSMSQFSIRCDGLITSSQGPLGTAFTNYTAHQGTYTPFKFTSCTRFRLHGRGAIDPGHVDALYFHSCSDFDISIDCRGRGQNSFMEGIYLQFCHQFRIHDMTIDSITAQTMQDTLTLQTPLRAQATSATAAEWTAGPGTFDVAFSNGDIRLVTFGRGTRNVRMSWSPGLSSAASATMHAEIYHDWLSNIAIFSCYDFRISNVRSRRAGMNGIYILSVAGAVSSCYNFDVSGNTCEYNAGSGIQITWAGGTTPNNYTCSNNQLLYNQADGIDITNTSGGCASIWAQFNHNNHYYNGWINCNPANPGGQDGSGLGTFFNVANFEVVGGIVCEPNNAGIALQNARNFRIANVAITKTQRGGHQAGIAVLAPIAYGTIENIDCVTNGLQTIAMQPSTDVTLRGLRLSGGPASFSTGRYIGCKLTDSSISSTLAINWVFDIIDCHITVTDASAQGIVASQPSVRSIRNTIAAEGSAVNTNGQRSCVVEDTTASVSGAVTAIDINGSSGCRVSGCYATATSGAAIAATGACDRTVFLGNRVGSASGHSFLIQGGCTNTILMGLTVISGPTSLGGTFLVNQP